MLWNVVGVGAVKLRSVWQAVQASPHGAGPVGRRKVDPAICALQPAGWQFMQRGWVSTFPISVKSVRERCTGSPMFWNAEGNLLLRREWPQALRQERRGEQAE